MTQPRENASPLFGPYFYFHRTVEGTRFTLRTDHDPLKPLFGGQETGKLALWLSSQRTQNLNRGLHVITENEQRRPTNRTRLCELSIVRNRATVSLHLWRCIHNRLRTQPNLIRRSTTRTQRRRRRPVSRTKTCRPKTKGRILTRTSQGPRLLAIRTGNRMNDISILFRPK